MSGNFNSGRRPDPVSAHKLRGTYRRDRHAKLEREGAPSVAPAPIEPFDWMSDEAKKFWSEQAPELQRLAILDHLSAMLFCVLCEAWATWRRTMDALKDAELIVETPRGGQVANPLIKVADSSCKTLFKLSEAFGMSPLGRRKLGIKTTLQVVDNHKPEDDMAYYSLGGGGVERRERDETSEILGFDAWLENDE